MRHRPTFLQFAVSAITFRDCFSGLQGVDYKFDHQKGMCNICSKWKPKPKPQNPTPLENDSEGILVIGKVVRSSEINPQEHEDNAERSEALKIHWNSPSPFSCGFQWNWVLGFGFWGPILAYVTHTSLICKPVEDVLKAIQIGIRVFVTNRKLAKIGSIARFPKVR